MLGSFTRTFTLTCSRMCSDITQSTHKTMDTIATLFSLNPERDSNSERAVSVWRRCDASKSCLLYNRPVPPQPRAWYYNASHTTHHPTHHTPHHTPSFSAVLLLFFFFLFFFLFSFFTSVLSPWDFSRGKFGLLSPGKVSCNRVALPNLLCVLGVLVFFMIYRTLSWTTGSLTRAQTLMHTIENGGVRTHVRESALKVDSGRKIPCRTGESNQRQRRAGPIVYQLIYIHTLKTQSC